MYIRSMQKLLQHIYIIPLFLSTLLSLKVFRLKWPAYYRLFSILLIFITATEISAITWKYYLHPLFDGYTNSNLWLYNISLILQYILYLGIYYQVIHSVLLKKIILVLVILYPIFAILNLIFFQPVNTINSYTIVFASTIVIFVTTSYFEQLRREEYVIKLGTHPMVWLSLGAFIFHAANLPYIISLNFLIKNNISLAVALYYIYLGLNCLLYSLFSIAFLCKHPHPRY